jgi:hypothetical protein
MIRRNDNGLNPGTEPADAARAAAPAFKRENCTNAPHLKID